MRKIIHIILLPLVLAGGMVGWVGFVILLAGGTVTGLIYGKLKTGKWNSQTTT